MQIWSAEIKELETLYSSLKGRVPKLEKELEQLIETQDVNVVLLYSRRCLEVMISELCECELKRSRGTEPLKGIIDKLSHEKKVPSNIIVSMEGLNALSTFGTHPKDFDPEQVKPALNNLGIIIKWYLKYRTEHANSEEEGNYERKEKVDARIGISKSGKKPIFLLSGIILVSAIIVAALFIFNILDHDKQTREIEKSIAVLPFKSLSTDPEKQYQADGMMDAIVLHLSKIEDLRVMARTSTEQYRVMDKTMTQIGRELGVNYLLEGSFQNYGDDIRLIVQLIRTGKEGHVWAEQYDRKWNDILSVQSEVAQAIARELRTIITPEEKEIIEKVRPTDLTAYDLYLKANSYLEDYKRTKNKNSYQKAVSLYMASVEIDSAFARVYTGLAFAYWDRYYYETYLKENFMDSCLVLANKAISFDDKLDEAYYLKGQYYYENGKIEEALENYDKTLKINPNYYSAYERKGWIMTSIKNDYVTGLDNYNNALKRIHGPERSLLLRDLAFAYKDIGFFEKARYYYNEAYTLDSNEAANLSHLFILAAVEEKLDEAIAFERKHQEIDSNYIPVSIIEWVDKDEAYDIATRIVDYYNKSGTLNLHNSHRVGFVLWRAGKIDEARKYIDHQIKYDEESIQLNRDIAQWMAAYYDLAIIYAFLGNKEKAYQYLEELNKGNTCQIRWIIYLKHDPPLESIRNEERFQKILQDYEAKYQAEHERVRQWLEEQGMLESNI